jgi:serine/threonine protein phosphatase PrpC
MAAIFDGHGGEGTANYCAKHLLEAVDQALGEALGTQQPEDLQPVLEQAIITGCLKTDEGVLQTSVKHDKSGCVAAMVFVDQSTGVLCAATVGDAQAMLCSQGIATRLSVIHKPFMPAEQQRIEAAGHYVVNGRLDGALAISRAFGDYQFKVTSPQVDGKEGVLKNPPTERACVAVPAMVHRKLEPTDEFIVIGCDGLWDVMNHDDAAAWVRRRFEIEKKDCGLSPAWCKQPFKLLAKELCEYAVTKGSTDNVSVIILLIEWKEKDAKTLEKPTGKPSEKVVKG